MNALRVAGACLALCWSIAAWSHAGSNAYLFVTADGRDVMSRMDLAVRDLDELMGLDENGDGRVTWAEVRLAETSIADYARSHLRLSVAGRDCGSQRSESGLQAIEHSDGWYAVIDLRHRCDVVGPVTAEYSGLFDFDASHRAQVRVDAAGVVGVTLLSPDRRSFELALDPVSTAQRPSPFLEYLRSGIHHVLTGPDHLLFLAGLFLPAALMRVGGRWQPMPDLRSALRRSAAIVTAFTLAHAVTLCLVALAVFSPPSRLVESLVAASVAFAGLNNLFPLVAQRHLIWLAAGFGLIHGAAIAGALLDLGLPTGSRVLALLGFNVGVELAQLLPVLLAVALTWPLRASTLYRRWVLVPGSVIVSFCGLVWLVTRALDLPSPF